MKGKDKTILKENSITPLRLYNIDQGEYTLVLQKAGYNSVTRKITVAGKKATVSGGSFTSDTAHPNRVTIPLETTIIINSHPAGADVFVDNKKLSHKTPVTVELEVGRKNIRIEKEGFDLIPHQCIIDLAFPVDRQKDVDRRFWKLYATTRHDTTKYHLKGIFWKKISIDSKPQGAEVYIDNEKNPLGKTRINDFPVPAGQHSFRFAMPGFQSVKKEIFIDGRTAPELIVSLNKIITFGAYDSEKPGADINAHVMIQSTDISGRLTPCRIDLPVKKFTAVFSKEPGYKPVTKTFHAGEINSVAVNMKRKKSSVEITVIEKSNRNPVSGAIVRIDKVTRGTTDKKGRWRGTLPAGRHAVAIDTKGRFPVKEKIIDCGSTGSKLITIRLTPATDGTLIVDTRPYFTGAKIFIDGTFAGETIRKMTGLTRDAHTVSVRHKRLADEVRTTIMLKKKQQIILKMDENGNFYQGE